METISYGANIVFITYGITQFFNNRKRNKEVANYLNGSYEMSARLSQELRVSKHSGQAQDIASTIKSVAMNFMNKKRNEIEKHKREKPKGKIRKILNIFL